MTSSLLEGQLWILGLTPTSLYPPGEPGFHIWKSSIFSLGQEISSTAGWAWARDPKGHCWAGCRGQSRIQPPTPTPRGACGLTHLSLFLKMETLKKPQTP